MIGGASTVPELVELVRGAEPGMRLLPVGGATKPALSRSERDDVLAVDVSGLSGVLEYDPAELTVTALAGTPVEHVQAALAEHGQYLPFDPPLARAGATLGGVVASGASGAGALHHGGVRDFVIGVRFIDGTGRLISGGGKVVKNAAGFDLPKLMVGSIGRLGVLAQVSFKVFPAPTATATLAYAFDGLDPALAAAVAFVAGPVELEALEVTGDGGLWARLGGRPDTLEARVTRLMGAVDAPATRVDGPAESALWEDAAAFSWLAEGAALVRVGLSIRRTPELGAALAPVPGVQVRFSLGGTVAWIGWPASQPLADLDALLHAAGLAGMVLIGPADQALLGPRSGGAFAQRVTHALDPDGRFLEVR